MTEVRGQQGSIAVYLQIGKRVQNFDTGNTIIQITQGRKPTEQELNFDLNREEIEGDSDLDADLNPARKYNKPTAKRTIPKGIEPPPCVEEQKQAAYQKLRFGSFSPQEEQKQPYKFQLPPQVPGQSFSNSEVIPQKQFVFNQVAPEKMPTQLTITEQEELRQRLYLIKQSLLKNSRDQDYDNISQTFTNSAFACFLNVPVDTLTENAEKQIIIKNVISVNPRMKETVNTYINLFILEYRHYVKVLQELWINRPRLQSANNVQQRSSGVSELKVMVKELYGPEGRVKDPQIFERKQKPAENNEDGNNFGFGGANIANQKKYKDDSDEENEYFQYEMNDSYMEGSDVNVVDNRKNMFQKRNKQQYFGGAKNKASKKGGKKKKANKFK